MADMMRRMSEQLHAVLGAGRQGLAAALEFATHGGAERVLLADRDRHLAEAAARRLDELAGRSVGLARELDAGSDESLDAALEGVRVALSALPYGLNPRAARAACRNGAHFVDLGGNSAVSAQVLGLDAEARAAGVTLVPDCGVAPGLAATLTALLVESFDEPESVRLRCGGLPQRPAGPLGYQISFSVGGLVNEYLGEADVLREGEPARVPTLTELEAIDLPEPLGRCEAFTTSGATSTLPATYRGRLRELDYKTVRYPGHRDRIAVLRDLGLWSDEKIEAGGVRVAPRAVFEAVAGRALAPTGPDLLVLRAEGSGVLEGRRRTRRIDLLDFEDETTGLTAMQRMTGFPAAMVAEALLRGEAEPGATPLELALPPAPLVEGLAARGIRVDDRWLDQ